MIRRSFALSGAALLCSMLGPMLGTTAASAQDAAAPSASPAPAAPAPTPTPTPTQAPTPVPTPPTKAAPKADIYDTSADGRQQIATALARAQRENRRVLIQWGANWCGWCHLLHELCASDKNLKRELLYEYDVVLIDIGRWDKHMELAASYGADLRSTGVPYLTVLAADGTVLANQETSALEAKIDGRDGHDPTRVLAFLEEHQAPYLDAETLHHEALAQAARDGKRVFLHFGAPWCGWCHKLENWMAQGPVAAFLARDFIDRKIDVDRTNGGAALLARLRGSAQGGIPWFQFVAADGSVLADCNGPQGNIGFPAAPEELAHFGAMLRAAALHLTDADIDTLLATLQPQPAAAPAAPAAAAPAGSATHDR